jgi:hypothetical protein
LELYANSQLLALDCDSMIRMVKLLHGLLLDSQMLHLLFMKLMRKYTSKLILSFSLD